MTIPEEDADVGQGSKYCLVAIGRLQVSEKLGVFSIPDEGKDRGCWCLSESPVYSVFVYDSLWDKTEVKS
jgi:hypothetical protein